MRFRLGLVTGFAAGYYLGAKAGRQRYEQINRSLARLKRSDAFEVATDRAKSVVEDGVEKARSAVETRSFGGGDATGANGFDPAPAPVDTALGTAAPTVPPAPPVTPAPMPTPGDDPVGGDPPTGLGPSGYSSSR